MNPDALPKATVNKYQPTHVIEMTLKISVTKNPDTIAKMIGQRAFTIDGVEGVKCAALSIDKWVGI